MHSSRSIGCLAARAAIVILSMSLVAAIGCPKQENFPAALDLVVPPTPTNFEIITQAPGSYSFEWEISDPTVVDHYLIRILGQGVLDDEIIAETNLNPFPYNPGISLTGLQFAVSSVSTQGVEGDRAVDTVE
jgi:hypothetical protein